MHGKFIREYPSLSEAARDEGVSKEAISCRLERKKCGDYQWRPKEEVEKDGKIIDIAPHKKTMSRYSYPVCQFGKKGTFIREYPSVIEAAEKTNIAKYSIFSCAAKKLKSTGGFQWQFKKEVEKDGKIMDIGPLKRKRSKHKTKSRYLYPVCQYGLDGTFIREYPSIIEAVEKTNIDKYSIFSCAAKKNKSTGGFQWRFKKEVVKKDGKITDIEPVIKIRTKYKIKSKYLYPVCQYGLDGTFIREYPSVIEAAEKTNIARNIIFTCTIKRFRTTHGFQWRFKEEVVKKDGKIPDIEPAKKLSPLYLHAVCQFDTDGTFIRVYPSIWAAANITDIPGYSIFLCASKKIEKRTGYMWRFKKDVKEKDRTIKDIEFKRPRPDIYRYLRAVCQFERNGKFIREYPSIKDAAKKNEASEESIYRCTQKKLKTTAGFQWRLKEDVVKKDGKIKDIEPDRLFLPHFLPAVCQFKQDGTLVREYSSIYEASKKTDITRSVIFSYARRKAKNRYGYLWRFKEDVVDKDGKISDIDTSKPVPYRYRRAVCQFGRDGKFIREYPSILDAAQKTSIYEEYISLCAKRRIKITDGFQWRHKDDPEFKNGITDIAPYERKESRRRKKKKE